MSFKRKPKDADEFIEQGTDQGQGEDVHLWAEPWDAYNVGPKSFNVRLEADDYAMLRWYFEEYSRAKSLQKMIKGMIRNELKNKIEELRGDANKFEKS